MINLLITGGAGFIGSCFVNYMSAKYPDLQLVVLDKIDYCASLENIDKKSLHNTEIIIGDIRNQELVTYILNKFEIDTIIHFAASTHVQKSFDNSIEFTENNVLGTHILLETVRLYQEKTNRIQKFVHCSTDEVYGETVSQDLPYTEKSILDATNPYASSKVGAESMAKSYYYSYKLPIIITRGNNVYGINQYPEKMVPKFICQLLNNEKITIQGNGTVRRNLIHVDDTCRAFEMILLKGEIGQIYNISSDPSNEYSVMEVAKILIKLVHPEIDLNDTEQLHQYLEYIEDRKFNDSRYFISSKKIEKLGWIPEKTNFVNNLKELIKWYTISKSRYGF